MTSRVIYVLRHPVTMDIRYVGVTARTIERRLYEHVYHSTAPNYHAQSRRSIWIRSLAKEGLKPIETVIKEVINGESWQDCERSIIAQLRADGVRLVNGTDGGEGVSGRIWSPNEEQRKRMGAAQIGKKASAETKAKRSASLKTRYASDPLLMEWRKELARRAARSVAGRTRARERMKSIWADPVKKAEMSRSLSWGWAERWMPEIFGE